MYCDGHGAKLPPQRERTHHPNQVIALGRPLPCGPGGVGEPRRKRTRVRYNMCMREEDVMRATDIGMVPLGYGRFVRADDIVAVLPIEEGRGRGRRTHVHVAGLTVPIVASRSEGAILADMKAASGAGRGGASSDERRSPRARQAPSAAPHRRSRLGLRARRA